MIEKEMPYTVPADFFKRFPEQTLLLAKQRKARRRRTKRLIRSVSMFSAAAVVLLLLTVVPPGKWQQVHHSENMETVLQDLSNEDLTKMTIVYGSELLDETLSQENAY